MRLLGKKSHLHLTAFTFFMPIPSPTPKNLLLRPLSDNGLFSLWSPKTALLLNPSTWNCSSPLTYWNCLHPCFQDTALCWFSSSFLSFFHSFSSAQLFTGRFAQGGILRPLSFSILLLFLRITCILMAAINMMMTVKSTSLVKCLLDTKSIIPTDF